ncbi:MAG: DUF2909 domain-containing protein [Moraxellaceae bacterium]|nr:DUF2909 domain-containing protein [Moraxellaceae bacterium]
MWIKAFVLLVMLAILVNLFIALRHLVKGNKDSSSQSLKHLQWRLGLSIALLFGLALASHFGIIAPHALQPVPANTAAPAP